MWSGWSQNSISSKHPMHEPLRGGASLAVEAGAVEPKASTARVLDHVVVARPLGRAAPPLGRDALRALRLGHLMQHAAPAEMPGRAVRHDRQDLSRLGA